MSTIHLIIAIVTGLTVLYADEQAAMWVLGKTDYFDGRSVRFLHRAVTIGLAALLITGGLMYYQAAPGYLSLGIFDVKMVTVFTLIVNTYFIDRFSKVALTRRFAELSSAERIPLYVSGAVSFIGWVTAITCGLLIA